MTTLTDAERAAISGDLPPFVAGWSKTDEEYVFAGVERILTARLAAQREQIAAKIRDVALDATVRPLELDWRSGFWDGIDVAAEIASGGSS